MNWATTGKKKPKPKPKFKNVSLDHDSESFVRGYMISKKLCNHLVENMNRMQDEWRYDPDREYFRLTDKFIGDKIKNEYAKQVTACVTQYEKEYRFAAKGVKYAMQLPFNFQMYEPGKSYKEWHMEDYGPQPGKFIRKFVFMTYLNDIKVGGGTEFLYQSIDVKPEKGLTLIWPAGWTHPHRGVVSPEERKYISTGWFVYRTKFAGEV